MVILGMVSGGVYHMRHLHRCIWKVHSEPPGALALHFCHFPSGCRVLIHRIDFRGFQLSKSFNHIFQKPRNAKKYGGLSQNLETLTDANHHSSQIFPRFLCMIRWPRRHQLWVDLARRSPWPPDSGVMRQRGWEQLRKQKEAAGSDHSVFA